MSSVPRYSLLMQQCHLTVAAILGQAKKNRYLFNRQRFFKAIA